MAANEKTGFWNDWKTKHPRWHRLLVLELACVVGLLIGLIWLGGTDIWPFWFKDSASVRDFLIALAAPVAFITAAAALRQASIAGKRHVEQTVADRERRITDSFTKAVELLGNDKLEARLGAIYALERIARESKQDHWPIMETLTVYVLTRLPVQHKVQVDPKPDEKQLSSDSADFIPAAKNMFKELPVDIRAVLTVLNRRKAEHEEDWQRIDFRGADLSQVDLTEVSLQEFDLSAADLRGADLVRTDLHGTDLTASDLRGADLRGAVLIEANLTMADLRGADLRGADLERAELRGTDLRDADLRNAHLRDADLRDIVPYPIIISRSDMSWDDILVTNLSGANLTGANLEDAELGSAMFCKTIMPDSTVNNRDCPSEPAPPNPSETPPSPN